MKNVFLALALAATLSPVALAAPDADSKGESSVTTSKNPITGTVTTTKKHKRFMKHGKNQAKLDVTETTKTKTSGEVDKNVEVKGDSTNK
ncbi:MAG: hypothetical protein ACXVB9_08535 [Bdellovibrionota bacterium]